MICQLTLEGKDWRFFPDKAIKIGVTLDFNGDQPLHFFASPARSRPWESDGFTGSVLKGSSCNVLKMTLIPHCQGTHTECLGHITNETPGIDDILDQSLIPALVVSVETIRYGDLKNEHYKPLPSPSERVISRASLKKALGAVTDLTPSALIIRSEDPHRDHPFKHYGKNPEHPAFFTLEAMELICELGVRHLLIELPSVDRMFDDGMMSNHRIFWGMPDGSVDDRDAKFPFKTITEMIWVPDEVSNGAWMLNLQIPAFKTDAAPSRPILYPMELM